MRNRDPAALVLQREVRHADRSASSPILAQLQNGETGWQRLLP